MIITAGAATIVPQMQRVVTIDITVKQRATLKRQYIFFQKVISESIWATCTVLDLMQIPSLAKILSGLFSISFAIRISKPNMIDLIGLVCFSITVQLSQANCSLLSLSMNIGTQSQPKQTNYSSVYEQFLFFIIVHCGDYHIFFPSLLPVSMYPCFSPQLTMKMASLSKEIPLALRHEERGILLGRTMECPKMRTRVVQTAMTVAVQKMTLNQQLALGLLRLFSAILNRCFQISIKIIIGMAYNRYKLPPDFAICQIHIEASLPLNEQSQIINTCPCCQRVLGSDSIPLCTPTDKLIKIGQEIPLYFMYIRMVGLFTLVISVLLLIQYFASNSIKDVQYDLQLPTQTVLHFTLGYVQTARWVRFIYFLIFSLLILTVRAYLKKHKYEGKNMVTTLSDRSIMLTNVHPQATVQDIKERFSDWDIEKVVFTYRVRDYFKKLVGIYDIKKQKILATKQGQSKLKLDLIQHRLDAQVIEAEKMSASFRRPDNQLDIVFITFRSASQRDVFLEQHQTSVMGRLFFKFCTCCSGTDILGQHVTVRKAPQPEDIDWLNLEYKYWTKKLHRITCYYMCFAILIYGVMFQYEISIGDDSNFTTTIIRTIVVFIGNFAIINLLEYTTHQIEKHELNSNKILSLVKKLTFFVFLNLSMSPLLIYVYNQFIGPEGTTANIHAFDDLCFSVLTISIGNIFKPLAEYFNVQRILKFFGLKYQRRKGDKCQLMQGEAHLAFEPIPFPLASFYSLLISSIFMTAFFLSCFQVIIIIEFLSCCVLYITSKYMLLKVCKEPVGFKDHIGRLSQRLLTASIYIYWFGDKIMYFCIVQQGNKNFGEYLLDFGAFGILQIILMVLIFLFSSTLIARVMKKIADDEQLRSSLIKQVCRNTNQINSYEDVNAIKTLQEEYKRILQVK